MYKNEVDEERRRGVIAWAVLAALGDEERPRATAKDVLLSLDRIDITPQGERYLDECDAYAADLDAESRCL